MMLELIDPPKVEQALKDEGWVSTAEAAAILGVHYKYLYVMERAGRLQCRMNLGRQRFYRRSEIEHYLATHPNVGKRRKISAA
jgi:excisionase family DNA binding protein